MPPSDALLSGLGLTTLHIIREPGSLNILFKINRNAPRYLQEIISVPCREIAVRKLRNSGQFSVSAYRLSPYKNAFIPATIRRWNNLPENDKVLNAVVLLRKQLRKT